METYTSKIKYAKKNKEKEGERGTFILFPFFKGKRDSLSKIKTKSTEKEKGIDLKNVYNKR